MRRSVVAAVTMALAAVLVPGCAPERPVDDEKTLRIARKAVAAARDARKSIIRDRNYDRAIGAYGQVMRQYSKYPSGAEAAYELGQLYQTAKGKTHNLQAAYDTYTTLLGTYRPGVQFDRVRFDYLEDREIDRIQRLVKLAEAEKHKVGILADKENSSDWKYQILDVLVRATGRIPWFSYWFAVVVLTVVVKILITPLTKAQFKAMKEMQKVAPLVKEIQEKYKGDQRTIGEQTMALYREHKINPFASCLPLLIQMPILFMLFYTIRSYAFQFENGTFFWIGSPLQHLYSFPVMGKQVYITAGNLAEADALLVLLYLVSMYVSTKMSAVDPTQAEQQKMMAIMMPVMFAFIFASFPAAFLLYWLVFNIIQTAQQYLILRSGREETAAVAPAPSEPETPDAGERVRRRRRRR